MKRKLIYLSLVLLVVLFVFKYCEEITLLKQQLYMSHENSINTEMNNLIQEKYNDYQPLDKNIWNIDDIASTQLIAHALGCSEGMPEYTNSLEALQNSYLKGFKIVETDILLTSDDEIVLAHDWYSSPLFLEVVPTKAEFLNILIDSRFHSMDFDDLISFMSEHADLYVLLDTKQGDGEKDEYEQLENLYQILYQKIMSHEDGSDIIKRIILNIYDEKQFGIVSDIYNFRYIYTGYKRTFDPIDMALFCLENNIEIIEISPSLITKDVVDIFKNKNIAVYTYSINTLKEMNDFIKMGVMGFETDLLDPNQIFELDSFSNINSQHTVDRHDDMVYITPDDERISITGVNSITSSNNIFYRLNPAHRESYPENIDKLAACTAGGRIRFKSNSAKLYIYIHLKDTLNYPYFAQTGSSGIDVYTGSGQDKKWCATLTSTLNDPNIIQDEIALNNTSKDITINLPLYSSIDSIVIGLEKSSYLTKPSSYSIDKPIVFYGSSITQGCSASRPGTSYPELVSRNLDANLINLGFSGSAKGEAVIANDIADLEMAAFIMEYDHNADDFSMLENTHYNFYNIVRNKHPDIPIILLSRCSGGYSISEELTKQREQIIKSTYNKAIKQGDLNTYFLSGNDIIPPNIRDDCLVDGIHPNDYGHHLISEVLLHCLEGKIH